MIYRRPSDPNSQYGEASPSGSHGGAAHPKYLGPDGGSGSYIDQDDEDGEEDGSGSGDGGYSPDTEIRRTGE